MMGSYGFAVFFFGYGFTFYVFVYLQYPKYFAWKKIYNVMVFYK